ncbi:hypothetical protein [Mesorhizobium sp.]|uniref:hypothetical protein n=1 Tax=Mesorhizobium sp. TaxID=1871066 RepID=UPI000FE65FAD|nr:hypothetical protein [Mesorhizobium sp.]RWA94493.1 MAG: hypothetical protein EOQ32_11640 [Mesorhizobium sp.]
MSKRYQQYIVNPPSACPPHLRESSGGPAKEISFDIDDVARCAWGEILQTAPRSNSLFALLEDLLVPGQSLIWRDNGPGRGTEMRRSFSGLFGRFFARAYLELHHGFVWFAAIDGDNFHLSESWRVSRKTGSQTEMPDWICARPGKLAIAEAKGSHQKGNATGVGIPGPIKTADGQIRGVCVQKEVKQQRGGTIWRSKKIKGWAVMSRWGLANPPRDPFLYALDPETDGKRLTSGETEELVQAVARTHVRQIASGLGILGADKELTAVSRRARVADDAEKQRVFAGSVITPFGLLNLDFDRARELAALLPNPNMVRFVGLDEAVLTDYHQNQPLVPRHRQRIGDLSIVGSDGLVVAPIDRLTDMGPQAGQS